MINLLEDLKNASWKNLLRTYGSYHNSLIGIIADWWLKDENNVVIDSALKSKRGKYADLLLISDKKVVGVVEVEGLNYTEKIKNLGSYTDGYYGGLDLSTPNWGILVCYSYKSGGKLPCETIIKEAKSLTNFEK